MQRITFIIALLLVTLHTFPARAEKSPTAKTCGEVVTTPSHDSTTTRYTTAFPQGSSVDRRTTLVLLAGGGGNLNLDDNGCPRNLTGNSLIRSIPFFHEYGFETALVDAPSDHSAGDGLAGFRNDNRHADDLGNIIAAIRKRTQGAVWLVGTSRGTISAVNAASRLSGPSAPDGIVLSSILTVGTRDGRKAWTVQTVFDHPLESIKIPVLLVGHAADRCLRSPPGMMNDVALRLKVVRKQLVVVSGGAEYDGPSGLAACEGRSPHGFIGQEAEVAAGIMRFMKGGSY